ncbi:MAG: hypothetical protein ACOYCD_03825 [Kiritimatiellia bacterium]|jgi:hypothetical protein
MRGVSLEQGEAVAGSWFVYLGEPTPMSAKVTGRLYVTNLYVRFDGDIALASGAAADISRGLKPFQATDTSFAIPYQRIASADVSRRWIVKTLNLRLEDGFLIPIQFGAMPTRSALAAIRRGLRRHGKGA